MPVFGRGARWAACGVAGPCATCTAGRRPSAEATVASTRHPSRAQYPAAASTWMAPVAVCPVARWMIATTGRSRAPISRNAAQIRAPMAQTAARKRARRCATREAASPAMANARIAMAMSERTLAGAVTFATAGAGAAAVLGCCRSCRKRRASAVGSSDDASPTSVSGPEGGSSGTAVVSIATNDGAGTTVPSTRPMPRSGTVPVAPKPTVKNGSRKHDAAAAKASAATRESVRFIRALSPHRPACAETGGR